LPQILKDATEFFSRKTPNLSMVIPAMDHLDKVFATNSVDSRYQLAIRASLAVAKRTINRYYSLTDSTYVYRIVMGEWSLFIYFYHTLTTALPKCFTLHTNSSTSRYRAGRRHGLLPPRRSFELNSINTTISYLLTPPVQLLLLHPLCHPLLSISSTTFQPLQLPVH
jgi:hypothetical protein